MHKYCYLNKQTKNNVLYSRKLYLIVAKDKLSSDILSTQSQNIYHSYKLSLCYKTYIHMHTYEFLIYLNIISAYLGTTIITTQHERIFFKLSYSLWTTKTWKLSKCLLWIPFAFRCCYWYCFPLQKSSEYSNSYGNYSTEGTVEEHLSWYIIYSTFSYTIPRWGKKSEIILQLI